MRVLFSPYGWNGWLRIYMRYRHGFGLDVALSAAWLHVYSWRRWKLRWKYTSL